LFVTDRKKKAAAAIPLPAAHAPLQLATKNTALFQHGLSTQNNRDVTKNKARRCQSRPPSPKPLSVVKAALRC
jgi:hypothetical protein